MEFFQLLEIESIVVVRYVMPMALNLCTQCLETEIIYCIGLAFLGPSSWNRVSMKSGNVEVFKDTLIETRFRRYKQRYYIIPIWSTVKILFIRLDHLLPKIHLLLYYIYLR